MAARMVQETTISGSCVILRPPEETVARRKARIIATIRIQSPGIPQGEAFTWAGLDITGQARSLYISYVREKVRVST